MQSDDLFVRKFRRQSPRPPLAAVGFDPMREQGVREWPPRRDGEEDGAESLTPSRAGLKLRPVGRSHIMQRSNSDVTLGDVDSSGKGLGNAAWAGGQRVGLGGKAGPGDSGVALRREYGSLSSLEKQMQPQAPISEDQAPLSPAALRFKDPFLLLGLPAEEPNPDNFFRTLSMPAGDSPKMARLPKPELPNKKAKLNHAQLSQPGCCDGAGAGALVRNLAHYDVQSMLFNLMEAASNRDSIGRKKNITSGASAASQGPQPASPSQAGTRGAGTEEPEQSPLLLDEGDGKDTDMLLSCPHFRNETGGEERPGLGQTRGPGGVLLSLQSPNDAVSVLEEPRESKQQGKSNYYIEFADLGAQYYRKYFYKNEHQNFFGIDDRFGPLAVSFRREEKEGCSGAQYNYRIIFRTTELRTLRGSLLEESVPSAARHTTPRGISPRKLLEFVMPELNLHCLRLASNSPKVRDTLLKLDEQGLNFQRKVGVMYCRAGQSSEEDMYNNESAGPAFDEFLDLLGDRVRLLGFDKYRAQLDNKTDSTGTHSLYTRYQDYEIMFHVSTMLPYTANNTQQLLRKRHIGNDIVTIVFQEPGALPFTPKVIRSHFQHVFIVVQVHHPCTDHTYYRVAVTRSMDIPLFGPLFPKGARFPRSPAFRDFLLAKAVNAENAAEKSEKFRSMATRTRQEYLKDLAKNYVTTTPIESSTKFQLPSLGGKRKDKLKGTKGAELHSAGALVWAVTATGDGAGEQKLPCLLAISAESVVLIERCSRKVVFNCCCRDVIGWKAGLDGGTRGGPSLDVFYERGQSVSVSMPDGQADDIREIVQRLELETRGCEAREVTPLRNGVGQPGFLLSEEGFVVELQPFGYAESGGLQLWARVVRLCGQPLVSLDLNERANLMRTAPRIHLTVIPPDENGKPRRSYSELYQRAIQDVECKAGEGPPGEAWVIDEREEEREAERERKQGEESKEAEPVGNGKTRSGEGCDGSLLSPSKVPLLRAASLQDSTPAQPPKFAPSLTRCYSLEKHPPCQDSCDGHVYDNIWVSADRHVYENVGELRNATPDLILAVNPRIPLEEEEEELQKQFAGVELSEEQPSASDSSQHGTQPECVDSVDRSSRALSLQKSISKILSETPEPTEEEWQSIAALDAACRSILAALSREDLKSGGGPEASSDCSSTMEKADFKESDSSIHLEEKVSQLESMLKKLQDDLQKEKQDKELLQAEVQSLRQNNQRLQEESQSTVARLIKVTELLCNVNKPC
ncbi:signal-induced proliferation-associated 1-like protein 2 [Megalops cyprinoides]|uniref:signal-induced proliferation-associated 1-like protein 2 n=1 Tax=Megalops cyprinoides TaxID=118141 RepID=UPI001864D06F|nr:signal-induced proliferation-associated 1-like protein 2 [Megalops cyprinoides]XP_036380179.1 signal-induced proliferation-associated 1-like protein 2 [Megalops cyprinoides]XP_036380180.1 signal-induced proliferation-associated 1-like protein 2 [Megalops cyprinoides]